MIHKGYVGRVEFDDENEIFSGEVINTADVITFQGTTVTELKKAFVDSVEDYLEFCAERGEAPEKPFSGKLNLRLNPDLHKEAYLAARNSGISLNSWINNAISNSINPNL